MCCSLSGAPRSSADCIVSSLSVPPSARVALSSEQVLYHVQPLSPSTLTSDTIIVTDYTEVELSSQEEPEEKLEELLEDETPAVDPALFTDTPAQADTSHDAATTATTPHNDTSAATNQPDDSLQVDESDQLNATDETDRSDACPEAGSDITSPQDVQVSISDVTQKPPARRGRGRPRKSTESTEKQIVVKTPRRRERAASVKPDNSAEER